MNNKEVIDIIVNEVGDRFNTFGGSKGNCGNNPIAIMLNDEPLVFSAGVEVKQVVLYTISRLLDFYGIPLPTKDIME